jgi:hypothetical protein
MKFLRKIQIAATSALVGLSLYGCSQQASTTSAPSTNQDTTAQPTAQMMSPTPTNNQPDPATAPSPTNNAPDSTTAASPLPETTMPTSTNQLPTTAPLPVTQ